jgi:hypothetical protein
MQKQFLYRLSALNTARTDGEYEAGKACKIGKSSKEAAGPQRKKKYRHQSREVQPTESGTRI